MSPVRAQCCPSRALQLLCWKQRTVLLTSTLRTPGKTWKVHAKHWQLFLWILVAVFLYIHFLVTFHDLRLWVLMYVIMCHNTDLSGPADLETLELLESESESLRSYEVHLYKGSLGNYTGELYWGIILYVHIHRSMVSLTLYVWFSPTSWAASLVILVENGGALCVCISPETTWKWLSWDKLLIMYCTYACKYMYIEQC